jgi:hypothetical protein
LSEQLGYRHAQAENLVCLLSGLWHQPGAFIGLLIVEFLSDPIFRADVGDYR